MKSGGNWDGEMIIKPDNVSGNIEEIKVATKKDLKIGMIFPGQGSQFLGMGKELHDKERIIQEYFDQASSCLDVNFTRLCFASSEKELRKAGAIFQSETAFKDIFATLTVVDDEKRFVTGQNQNSGHETANAMMKILNSQ